MGEVLVEAVSLVVPGGRTPIHCGRTQVNRIGRSLLMAALAIGLVACSAARENAPPPGGTRRLVPRPAKPVVTLRHPDGTTTPSTSYVIDQTFNTLNNGFFVDNLPWNGTHDNDGLKFVGPNGPALIPRGRKIYSYRTLRLDVGPPNGPRHAVDFAVCEVGKWVLSLEPDDYPWPTIPSDSPTHDVRMGIYHVRFVEGEPVEMDIPGIGTFIFVPWLVDSIEVSEKRAD